MKLHRVFMMIDNCIESNIRCNIDVNGWNYSMWYQKISRIIIWAQPLLLLWKWTEVFQAPGRSIHTPSGETTAELNNTEFTLYCGGVSIDKLCWCCSVFPWNFYSFHIYSLVDFIFDSSFEMLKFRFHRQQGLVVIWRGFESVQLGLSWPLPLLGRKLTEQNRVVLI